MANSSRQNFGSDRSVVSGGELRLFGGKMSVGTGGGGSQPASNTRSESGSSARKPPMSVQLKVIEGPHQGKEFQFLEHDNFIVGRGKQAHFRLPQDDRYFSRMHFLLEVNPPHCRLLDLGSRNGTRVNGQLVQTADLKNGDLIAAGKTRIQVVIEVTPTEVPAVTQPAPHLVAGPSNTDSEIDTRFETVARQTLPVPEVSGFELLPEGLGDDVAVTVHDPHGCLPPDYRNRIRKQAQPIAGFQLIQELGRGGMGSVYLAIRERDQSIVAVKTVLPGTVANPRDKQRFLREAEILQQLVHPHIVAYRESGECDGLLYFAMDLVPGPAAQALLTAAGGKLPRQRAIKIILQLLTALRYAHAEGFVHRDIKPSNLLVTTSGSEDFVKLADFGLARAYQASGMSGLTMSGEIGGTIAFMSPEQIIDFRKAQPTTDQYAAAASLYYLLCGQFIYDFPAEAGKRLLMILEKDPVPIQERQPDVPDGLAAAIHRGLSRDPAARFPDVRGFHAAIEPYAR